MENKKIIRGISKEFADKIKQDLYLQSIYANGSNEIICGIRNNYMNLYYNSDSIARVKPNLDCVINEYYLTGKSNSKDIIKSSKEILDSLDEIKKNSDKRTTAEKKAQQKLFSLNNGNLQSNWYCIDIEYVKAYRNKGEKDIAAFSPRFDIIAVSKTKPFRIAIIELKYGKGTYVGVSGIKKHIVDFDKFKNGGYFNNAFKQEITEIIEGLAGIGVELPAGFDKIDVNDFADSLEFYFITLDNNAENERASTPEQTCGGYLFKNNPKWNSLRFSKNNIENEFGDITIANNKRLYVKFLFSKQRIEDLAIDDIIDGQYDEGEKCK